MRVLILCIAVLIGGCASMPALEKQKTFMEQCVEVATLLDCTYSDYNRAVVAVNDAVKENYAEGRISDETKAKYKERIIQLNKLADDGYALGNVDDIRTQRGALKILEALLRQGLDPDEGAKL